MLTACRGGLYRLVNLQIVIDRHFASTYIWALKYFALMRQNSKERKAFVRHTNDFARNDMVKPMQGKQLRWRIREMTSLSGDRFWNYKWLFVGLVLIYSKGSSLWTKGVFLLIIPYFQKNHKKAWNSPQCCSLSPLQNNRVFH